MTRHPLMRLGPRAPRPLHAAPHHDARLPASLFDSPGYQVCSEVHATIKVNCYFCEKDGDVWPI